MRELGLACRCIRCRQVRENASGRFKMIQRRYEASEGTELFLSFEDTATQRLASLLRLRIPSPKAQPLFGALSGAALIRELHSYGLHLPLHRLSPDAVQHQGLGQQLVQEAERLAQKTFGFNRVAVIAGVGVREYYRRMGYRLEETYMVKDLSNTEFL